ncbi:MAG: hypothetical protein OXU83_06985, partial [Gammaproteobacteria bacterium]|nr:hypothetical protein [Gammaproteobacteria bacterium]
MINIPLPGELSVFGFTLYCFLGGLGGATGSACVQRKTMALLEVSGLSKRFGGLGAGQNSKQVLLLVRRSSEEIDCRFIHLAVF